MDALRELSAIRSDPDVGLASIAAMVLAHRASRVPDQDAIFELEDSLLLQESAASLPGRLLLARVLLLQDFRERARSYVERVMDELTEQQQYGGLGGGAAASLPPSTVASLLLEARNVLGWVLLAQSRAEDELAMAGEDPLSEALTHFEAVLAGDATDLDAVLGRAHCLLAMGRYQAAYSFLGEIVARYAWFVPALEMRAVMQADVGGGAWEAALDDCQRLLAAEERNLTAIELMTIHALSQTGDAVRSVELLKDLRDALLAAEPRNAALAARLAKSIQRVGWRNLDALQTALSFADVARKVAPMRVEYFALYAELAISLGKVGDARSAIHEATHVDALNLDVLIADVRLKLIDGDVEEAQMHLESLVDVESSLGHAGIKVPLLKCQCTWAASRRKAQQARGDESSGGLLSTGDAELDALTQQAARMGMEEASTSHTAQLVENILMQHMDAMTKLADEVNKQQSQQQHGGGGGGGVSSSSSSSLLDRLDPPSTLELIDLLAQHAGYDARTATEPPSPLLTKCLQALALLTRLVPGLLGAQLLAARCLYLNADLAAAQRKCSDIIFRMPRLFEGHYLAAKVCLRMGKPQGAFQGLQHALSQDLALREAPQFLTISARTLLEMGKSREAVTLAEQAVKCRGIRPSKSSSSSSAAPPSLLSVTKPPPSSTPPVGATSTAPFLWTELSVADRCAAYITLMDAYDAVAKRSEAAILLDEATSEFTGTPLEAAVLLARARLLLGRGDVSRAVRLLDEVDPLSSHYLKARIALADLHLHHRNDPAAYAACYREVVTHRPDAQTYMMLGEALLAIQEPEAALEALEQALRRNPRDLTLIRRVCSCLVTSHEYAKAMDRYRAGMRNHPQDAELPFELAQLYIRLGMYDEARPLLEALRGMTGGASVTSGREEGGAGMEGLVLEVKAMHMMAKAARAAATVDGNLDAYLALNQECMARRDDLLAKLRIEAHPEVLREHRVAAAELRAEAAAALHDNGRSDEAVTLLHAAMAIDETSDALSVQLARTLVEAGRLEEAVETCEAIRTRLVDHPEATLLLADALFLQGSYEQALYHYTNRLATSPTDYRALSRLVRILRRAGQLSNVPRFLTAAAHADPRHLVSAGLKFCRGLFLQYSQKLSEALLEFNASRKDSAWATESLLQMIEIYLGPESIALWANLSDDDTQGADEAPESHDGGGGGGGGGLSPVDASTRSAVLAARRLLNMVKLKPGESPTRYKLLQAYSMMALHDKSEIEQALRYLLEMASRDRDHVPILLALATAFLLLNQTAKARNQLKRISKLPYKPMFSDEYERAWLQLADIYMRSGKYDLAQELCNKCLKFNKSCARAWEYSGQMLERESAYRDAAEHYERAWRLDHETSPQIGYRLAFNYLKASRVVDAIDVCHKVLQKHPEFPGLKREVLDRAREALRT